MIPILDWIFEGIVGWVASIVSSLMDAVSGLFLEALGTDMTAMEEYFPFVAKAYDVMQITAWAILILITVWQLFRAFGGPITEAENPWHLIIRAALFALLIGYAKPIFTTCLSIARAPYTSLMDITMTGEDFTFAGVEQALTNGLTTLLATLSVVGMILILILEIALGWNYFKLLLETVERYIVVGVLCYTSPLAFSMGGSKTTNNVFRSWCRMVGSQLLLLVMNVWFLRGFSTTMGQFVANGGALSTGKGSVFLWLFCALAYLKTAQRFDSYLAAIGLNVAQTGSGLGMELLMAARVITGVGSGMGRAGNVFRGGGGNIGGGPGAAGQGFAAGFMNRFNPNSYVRDAVVQGGQRMGFGGGAGFFGRAFGGIAARNGATLNSNSISSVATRAPNASGTIAGDIADRSLGNYMPHMQGFQLQGTQITGGHISTTAIGPDGKTSTVDMFNAAQYEKPDVPHGVVTASDGSSWYQMASGEGRGAFYDAPVFNGPGADAAPGAAQFGTPSADGTVDMPQGNTVSVDGGGETLVVSGGSSDGVHITNGSGEVSADGGSVVGDSYGPNHIPGDVPGDAAGGMAGDGYGSNAIPGYPMGDPSGDPSGDAGGFYGGYSEAPLVAATFPGAPEGTMLRTVDEGVLEASTPDGGNTLWYNSAYFEEPDAPHSVMQAANGVDWYAIQQHADAPQFEPGEEAAQYNQAAFQQFMPGYEPQISQVDGSHREDGHFEVRNADGSGTAFYDVSRYAAPRGDYQVFEDAQGSQWYAIHGEAAVERKPVFEDGKPVYDGDSVRTVNVDTVRYKQTPSRFADPDRRGDIERKPPRRKM